MDEAKQAMLDYVTANGGRVAWGDMVDNMPSKHRNLIVPAFYQLKAEKKLARQNVKRDGNRALEVFTL